MQLVDKKNHLFFCKRKDVLYMYNNLTGLYYEIDEEIMNSVKHGIDMWDKESDIYRYFEENSLILGEKDYSELFIKVNPYAIWNNDIAVFSHMGTIVTLKITDIEAKILENSSGNLTFHQIADRLDLEHKILGQYLKKFIDYKTQLLKLHKSPWSAKTGYLHFQFLFEPVQTYEKPNIIDLEDYYGNIKDSIRQFEDVETTVSYLLRNDTDILNGLSYGKAFCYAISEDWSNSPLTILEVGGGTGVFAKNFVSAIIEKSNEFKHISYMICDISPALLESQKTTCDEYSNFMNFVHGRGEKLPFRDETFDYIISNEVIADMLNVKVKEVSSENPLYSEMKRVIATYDISIPKYYLNLGSILFLEEVKRVLKQNGVAIITEYFDHDCEVVKYVEDHQEVGINFDILKKVAQSLNMEIEIISLSSFLKIDESVEILDPLNYENLKELCKKYSVDLQKLIYSKNNVEEYIKKFCIKNVRFQALENITKFFKVMIVKKL